MKKTKGQAGITLIALVVTIVVLLILAGVTITFVLSDTSVFDAAKKAKTDTMLAAVKEYAGQFQLKVAVKYYTEGVDLEGTGEKVPAETGSKKFVPADIAPFFPDYDVLIPTDITVSNGKVTAGKITLDEKGADATVLYTVTFKSDGTVEVVSGTKAAE